MPFTPAHAAAALPFLRLRLVPSALVVGSMAPDFEYFLRFASRGGYGHTIPGAFTLSLPLALLVLWMFHFVVKEPLVQLLPNPIRLRLPARSKPFRFGPAPRFLLIVLSALIGIATHILWDSFTHRDTWFVWHSPFLNQTLQLPVLGTVHYYKLLQHGSSILGLAVLIAWLARWYRATPPRRPLAGYSLSRAQKWTILLIFTAIAVVGGSLRMASLANLNRSSERLVAEGVITAIALAWWQLVAYAFIIANRRPARTAV